MTDQTRRKGGDPRADSVRKKSRASGPSTVLQARPFGRRDLARRRYDLDRHRSVARQGAVREARRGMGVGGGR